MWELLVTKKVESTNETVIGMGENLAHLLIASYGGHFFHMTESLDLLMTKKEFFSLDMVLNPLTNNITKVLKKHPHEGPAYLRQMAECGFAPVAELEEEVVEMIVKSNIGGIVSKEKSVVVGLPDTIWKKHKKRFVAGLVPTSESAHNLIAINVLYFEEERRLKEERRRGRRWSRIRFWRKEVT
jgi:hypothetical protein